MNVIFLDIDGVVNRCGKSECYFEPELMANLAWLVRNSGAFVVLSSTWRMFLQNPTENNEHLRKQLHVAMRDHGIVIHSLTPDHSEVIVANIRSGVFRGNEIQAWLDEHPETNRFVILDDNSDMLHLLPHLVRTNPYEGLTKEKAQEALQRLQEPS